MPRITRNCPADLIFAKYQISKYQISPNIRVFTLTPNIEFELIEQQVFENRKIAKTAIFEFIEVFYNRQRGHQTLDYKTPLMVEQEYRLVA